MFWVVTVRLKRQVNSHYYAQEVKEIADVRLAIVDRELRGQQ